MSADDKPRRLSAEDHAIWRSITRSIVPLKPKRAQPLNPYAPDKPRKTVPPPRAPAATLAVPPRLKALPPLMRFDRRVKQALARGRTKIDARLDLHGRSQGEAHAALLRFLHRAQRDGARTVLVITGKGGDLSEGRGVLRRQVPLWLALPEFRAFVLGVEGAHIAHGGEGALYVRLRRAKG